MARIIAIDDEQAILDVIERILKRDGHDVLCLADPTSALKLNLARADLILCDVMMPGIDGFELVRELRPRFDGPIVFLTAKVAEEDAVTGYGLAPTTTYASRSVRPSCVRRLPPTCAENGASTRMPSPLARFAWTLVLGRSRSMAHPSPLLPRNMKSASTLPAIPVRCSAARKSARRFSVGSAKLTMQPFPCT